MTSDMTADQLSLTDFHGRCVGFLAETLSLAPSDAESLGPDRNLLETGLIDSFALLELCMFVETMTGATVDITELEIEQFSSIGALHKLAVS